MEIKDRPLRITPVPGSLESWERHYRNRRAHQWPVESDKFGPAHDYYTHELESKTAIYAVSEAALQWCYRFLPAWVDRWQDRGFIVEDDWIPLITAQMRGDKLMSLEEYDRECCHLNEQQQQQNEE